MLFQTKVCKLHLTNIVRLAAMMINVHFLSKNTCMHKGFVMLITAH